MQFNESHLFSFIMIISLQAPGSERSVSAVEKENKELRQSKASS